MQNTAQHWNTVYATKSSEELGWYEENSERGLGLIQKYLLEQSKSIFLAGIGRSILVSELIKSNYKNLILNDISQISLDKLKLDLPENQPDSLSWFCANLGENQTENNLPNIDLWFDRAVLHFLIEETERINYFNLIRQKVQSKGVVILAQFAENGAEKCSNLPVFQYNNELFSQLLGNDFELKETFNHLYINPFGGKRPYIYTVFQCQ